MNQTSAGLPAGSNYTYTKMELKDTTLLFIVAIVVCALVVFFCLLSVAVTICLVVHCVKLYKTSAALGDKGSRKKRGKEGAREPQDDSKGDNGMQLRALRAITCSVESITNGNYKQNPQYSKVEYLVSLQLIHAPTCVYVVSCCYMNLACVYAAHVALMMRIGQVHVCICI